MPETPEQAARRESGAQRILFLVDHGTLKSRGGLPRALALLGEDRLPALLEELHTALAA